MVKNLKKIVTKGTLLFGLIVTLGSTFAVKAEASTPPFSKYVYGEVADNGVRLRKTPGDGTVLELMYKDEVVWVDLSTSEVNGYRHVQRDATGTVGYVASNLIIIY